VRDSLGRQRFFHGTNVVYKKFPFHPILDHWDAQYSFSAEDMELMYNLGYNAIRLGCAWAGAEPTKDGGWNATWFETVEGIVDSAGSYGLFSLLDHHQDAYSTKVCGTGFPDWTVADTDDKWLYKELLGAKAHFPAPLAEAFELRGLGPVEIAPGEPNKTLCWNFTTKTQNNFPLLHATFQTALSYEEMYDNVDGKLDRFALFWAEVARRTADNKRVLGYELSNEPFSGDFYSHPLNFLPWNADRNRLQATWDKISSAVRPIAPEQLIFWESVTWEVTGISERIGYDHAPGGAVYANKSILSFHNDVRGFKDDPTYYAWREAEAKRLGVAAMVTETGGDQLNLGDAYAPRAVAGWMHWDYKKFADWTWDSDGIWNSECVEGGKPGNVSSCLCVDCVSAFTRFYAQAVAGTLVSISFNATNATGTLVFTPDRAIHAPTVLFVPTKFHFPTGFKLSVVPAAAATWNVSDCGSYVTLYTDAQGTASQISVSVVPS